MRHLKTVLISLSLLTLSACSGKTVVTKEPARMYPPMALTMDTRLPDLSGETYADVIAYAIDMRASLRQCNANMESLREWASAN